jgi:NAD(P)-dependent dehydrogenase (short-subunit alcohol dehydrogenase family)
MTSGGSRLAGKRVLVVGAGTMSLDGDLDAVGNGRAISVQAASEGASLVCADVNAEAAERTAAYILEETGTKAGVVIGDVSVAEDCARIVAEAADLLGGLDGVVLNVGILAPIDLGGTDGDAWTRILSVNARSHALIGAKALDLLDDAGAVVTLSSVSAFYPGIRQPAYDASKAAATAIMRNIAAEGAPRGIRANAVVPGVVDTPLGAASASAEVRDRSALPLPLGRRGTPWDVAKATVFLLSDDAGYITGQSLFVDGGMTALTFVR